MNMAACAKLSLLSELSRNSSLSLRKTLFNVPFFPFNAVLFNAKSAEVCPHAVTLLGSNVKDQPPYFLKFLLFMGVSPNFGWGTFKFRVASQYSFLNSLVFSCRLWSTLLIGRDSYPSSVEMSEVFKVSYRILKVLCDEFSLFLSHNQRFR